ncbi:MAG: sigma-54 dependent transcriptional regulator [Desulfobacterales bacterium]
MADDLTILVVEQGESQKNTLVNFLKKKTRASVLHAGDPSEALEITNDNKSIKLLVTDLFLPDKQGLELIQKTVSKNPALVPIVLMPPGDRQLIVESLQAGAHFHVGIPYDYKEILEVIKNCVEYQKLLQIGLNRKPALRKSDGFCGIIGESQPMKFLFKTIESVSSCEHGNVLLQGESGTGKELVARAIHDMTPERSQNNFVPVNCAAIPEDLLESELFGYEKGAFTGANRPKIGRLQHADKGSLFLDEIGDMKPGLQAKLLRVLQEQVFEPIGSVKSIKIDIRVIAATNCDLEKLVSEGRFREDLFYRLNVVPISLPPLKERKGDIPHLVEKFLLMYNRGRQNIIRGFTPAAMQKFEAYDWPGNVRELQNLVQRLCILHNTPIVDIDALPQKFQRLNDTEKAEFDKTESHYAEQLDFHAMTVDFENRLILHALFKTNWNKKEAAKMLNMKRTTLLEKIKRRNLSPENKDIQP